METVSTVAPSAGTGEVWGGWLARSGHSDEKGDVLAGPPGPGTGASSADPRDARFIEVALVLGDALPGGQIFAEKRVYCRRVLPLAGDERLVEEFRVPSGRYCLRLTALGPSHEVYATGTSPVFAVRPWRRIEAFCTLVCPGEDKGYAALTLLVRVRHRLW